MTDIQSERADIRADETANTVMEFCAARKVSCLDLLPTFEARKNEEFYRAKDDQLNEKGNYVASQSIREFLLRNALLMAQRRVEG